GLAFMGNAMAAPQTITSGPERVSLLELYTSEGCSSCPPAEAWLSGLIDDSRLWKQLVPVAFHVDYWDDQGWRDPFDSPEYTDRQKRLGGAVIYTPEFMVDGREWDNWFNHWLLKLPAPAKAGVLSLTADGRRVTVHFIPSVPVNSDLEVEVVLLAFGVDVPVGAGENQGATLRHDFLVVSDAHGRLALNKDSYDAVLNLPPSVTVKAARYALAGWVSASDDAAPIQTVGAWLADSLN
ncbi:MAG TPA: DUF1223 domain-containing protein, partial [Gammaproteobacteria bacterium]|nr:DUF1223 domain-containing protein [Gammaproteobacteria bacterium]